MIMFDSQVLHVSELAERLRMSVIWHATEAAICHGLEVSVTSERSVVLVHFFVAVSFSPSLIFVLWFRD